LTILTKIANFNLFGGFMQGTIHSPTDLAPYIDHTLLKADACEQDIARLCMEALKNQFKAVCVNSTFVSLTREYLSRSNVLSAAVVGFPLGAHLTYVKALEAELAVADGASEIDMVLRIDLVKTQQWRAVEADIAAVVKASGTAIVKVILETGLLNTEEIVGACKASEGAGAAFVKTATGFLGRGATIDDVRLMRTSCSTAVKIKASGGIKTFAQAADLIANGADRLGTSSGVFLVSGDSAGSGGY
jgi:deoxyribose-phosphate aldolase